MKLDLVPVFLSIIILGQGCANSVAGKVGDYLISGISESTFTYGHHADGEISKDFLIVHMTNIANACEFYEQSEDVENPDCETYCSGWRDLDQQYNLPAKVWDLDIHLQDGDGFVGDYTPSHFNSNQGSARISYTDISVLTDYAACMAACDAIEPFIEELESRQNENMTMSVNDYQEDESVKGNFSIDLDGGYNADGHFSASYCNFRSWRW